MPRGRFPVYFNWTWPGESGLVSRMGYDAVVCVQKYEPWVIETYDTSIRSASALCSVGGGNGSTPLSPDGTVRGAPIADVTRNPNTTGKDLAFSVARKISFSQWTKLTTGRGEPYIPSRGWQPTMRRGDSGLWTSSCSTLGHSGQSSYRGWGCGEGMNIRTKFHS